MPACMPFMPSSALAKPLLYYHAACLSAFSFLCFLSSVAFSASFAICLLLYMLHAFFFSKHMPSYSLILLPKEGGRRIKWRAFNVWPNLLCWLSMCVHCYCCIFCICNIWHYAVALCTPGMQERKNALYTKLYAEALFNRKAWHGSLCHVTCCICTI